MANTGLESESIDVYFSTFGPFWIERDNSQLILAILTEAHRILRTGGVLRISPLIIEANNPAEQKKEEDKYIELLNQRVDLKVVRVESTPTQGIFAVELKKIR